MEATGKLTWNAPRATGPSCASATRPPAQPTSPPPNQAAASSATKLSSKALDVHFAGMLGKIIKDLGPRPKTLNNVLIDSYEVGCQNWTPLFRQDFEKRRGYDRCHTCPS